MASTQLFHASKVTIKYFDRLPVPFFVLTVKSPDNIVDRYSELEAYIYPDAWADMATQLLHAANALIGAAPTLDKEEEIGGGI